MDKAYHCPSCGKKINFKDQTTRMVCQHCNEALLISPDKKIVLANPIQTYWTLDAKTATTLPSPNPQLPSSPGMYISSERRKRAARYAYEHLLEQEELHSGGLKSGILILICGGLIALFGWLRYQYFQNDWISWGGLGVGIIVLLVGALVTHGFYRTMQTHKKSKHELEQELQVDPTDMRTP